MLFERIESEGLAHYSYLLGSGNEAVVIDPRRDCQVYVDRAAQEGMRITHILETHRNEDYVIGSTELAARTGAEIWHADSQLDYAYGNPVADGQRWRIGEVEVRALASPGHTPGMMNYLLHDAGGRLWGVCTGDTLFAGSVGRVDLAGPERTEEMAGLLYDSIFERLLPLGDGVLVLPAHGPGSVCGGSSIADRPWTTLGIERRHNPRLQVASRQEFVEQTALTQPFPPYFAMMERLNLEGTSIPTAAAHSSATRPRGLSDRRGRWHHCGPSGLAGVPGRQHRRGGVDLDAAAGPLRRVVPPLRQGPLPGGRGWQRHSGRPHARPPRVRPHRGRVGRRDGSLAV